MAQTTDSIWGGAAYAGISTDGSSWTEISSHGISVTPEGGDRRVGETYVFDDENAIVKVGKLNPRETRVDFVYTEQAADAFEVVRAQFESAGGGTLYVRWSPNGGGIGDAGYTSDAGFCSDLRYPEVDSEADGPIVMYFVCRHASLTRSIIATAW
jgi:hypothetical protein